MTYCSLNPSATLAAVIGPKGYKMCHCVILLGRVALVAQRPIVVKLSRGRSVGLCVRAYVRASVYLVHCGKTADRIRMPFGIV